MNPEKYDSESQNGRGAFALRLEYIYIYSVDRREKESLRTMS